MTKDELNTVKARLGSLSPMHLQKIRALSETAYKLISNDLPLILNFLEPTPKKDKPLSQVTGV